MATDQVVTLCAVLFGWLLAEATETAKGLRRARILRRALLIELADTFRWIERARLIQEKGLLLISHECVPESLPLCIPSHVFDEHYAELSIRISQSERVSFSSIFALVRTMNEQHRHLGSIRADVARDPTPERLQEFATILEASLRNGCMAEAQIKFHLAHSKRLDITRLKDEDAERLDQEITQRLLQLRAEASRSTIDDIRRRRG
jgi:hypothetical protein